MSHTVNKQASNTNKEGCKNQMMQLTQKATDKIDDLANSSLKYRWPLRTPQTDWWGLKREDPATVSKKRTSLVYRQTDTKDNQCAMPMGA